MLTLDPDSSCDICAESYGHGFLPHSIPCGHVFCAKCLGTICEKNPQNPSCPFCREAFTDKMLRPIRVDLSNSPTGTSSITRQITRGNGPFVEIDDAEPSSDLIHRRRMEAKALEAKVAKAAETKSSFEDVSNLHKEVQNWLQEENKVKTGKHTALRLSSALLRAILLNSVAYTESAKTSRTIETSLKDELDLAEQMKKKLEVELKRQRQLYSEKLYECQQLQEEIARLRRSGGAANPANFYASPPPSSATPTGSPYTMPARPQPRYGSSLTQTPTPTASPAPLYRGAVPPSPGSGSSSSSSSAGSSAMSSPASSAPSSPHSLPSVRPQTPSRVPGATQTRFLPNRTASPATTSASRSMSSAAASLGVTGPPAPALSRTLSAESEKKLQSIQALERAMMEAEGGAKPQAHERWLPNVDYEATDRRHYYGSTVTTTPTKHSSSSHSRSASMSASNTTPRSAGGASAASRWTPQKVPQ